uniref:Uncharacterized protein n=1 Tax=Panstrongylus lignarius TaxID=156445 RepID=A0A224XWJ7_9HEMI
MVSAPRSAAVLAEATLCGCESGITPLPMGVARKGNPVWVIKVQISFSARAYAAPLPMITRGLLENISCLAALSISVGSG